MIKLNNNKKVKNILNNNISLTSRIALNLHEKVKEKINSNMELWHKTSRNEYFNISHGIETLK